MFSVLGSKFVPSPSGSTRSISVARGSLHLRKASSLFPSIRIWLESDRLRHDSFSWLPQWSVIDNSVMIIQNMKLELPHNLLQTST